MARETAETAFATWLEARTGRGLARRLRTHAHPDGAHVVVAGRRCVDFSSNDYLGLARDPRLAARAADWAARYGTGAGASRLVTGNLPPFAALEEKIAAWKGKPAALVMVSGFQANASVLEALFDRRVLKGAPHVLADRLNHASMHFGCRAAGVRQHRYRHGDADHLAALLREARGEADGGGRGDGHGAHASRFILTETVFSMEGDVAPMARLRALARDHGALLIADDAHATGILGPRGAGLAEGADIVIGTFGKAMGSFGAYVACSNTLRDYLVNRCGGLIYATALPPPVLGAIDAALDLVPHMDAARARVAAMAARFRSEARALGFDVGASCTQIVPLILGESRVALALSRHLAERGLWAPAIRPPTVPEGTARLRLAFSAAHEEAHLDRLLEALAAWVRDAGREMAARGAAAR